MAVWQRSPDGTLLNGQPQGRGRLAFFKNSQAVDAGDIVRMRFIEGARRTTLVSSATVGFASEMLDVERFGEHCDSTASVHLATGTTRINKTISTDGQQHVHLNQLRPHIPTTAHYEIALRVHPDGNAPQIQINEDGEWHDLSLNRSSLKAGPWFVCLQLDVGDRVSNFRVDRPKATKSAGKTKRAPCTHGERQQRQIGLVNHCIRACYY